MSNIHRKVAEEYIIKYVGALLPEPGNKVTTNQEIYTELFASMSDKQFDDFMKGLADGSSKLAIISPNFGKQKLSIERNLKLAEELEHNFFERIWMNSNDGSPPYLSNVPYLIVDLPLRRQAQLLIKKISIPEDNKSIDDLTGQPTGKSKGSKISYPETQILAALDLEHSLTELLKFRGGDRGGFNAMNTQISNTGGSSLASIERMATGVTSTDVLRTLFTCCHLSNTL
jgi:hypothetical protein